VLPQKAQKKRTKGDNTTQLGTMQEKNINEKGGKSLGSRPGESTSAIEENTRHTAKRKRGLVPEVALTTGVPH